MTTLRDMLAERARLRDQMTALHTAHAEGALPEAEQRSWDAWKGELEGLERRIERQSIIDSLDRAAPGQPIGGGADSFEAEAEKVTLLDVVRAQLPGTTDAASGRAREVSREMERRSGRTPQGLFYAGATRQSRPEQRVFTTTNPSGGPGSNLIATDVGPLIPKLYERLTIRSLGATVLPNQVANLSLPRLKSSATAYWFAENAAITPSDPSTDAVPMSPHHVGGRVEFSRNMAIQSDPNVSQMIENDLMRILAIAIDKVAVQGGGADEPKGLLEATSGITRVAMAGAALSWNDIIAMISEVDVSNALTGSLAFLTSARVVAKLRRTLKTTPDTASNFIMNDATTLAGYPLANTQLMPASGITSEPTDGHLIYGAWENLVLAFWGPETDILVNPYESVAYSKGNIQVRAISSVDVGIKQPLAFSARTTVGTASF